MYLKAFLLVGAMVPILVHAGQPRAVVCSYSTAANEGDTCESFSKSWGMDMAKLQSLNPAIECPDLVVGQMYCVVGTLEAAPVKASTTATSTTTKTSSVPQYSPTQPGLVKECDKFHLVSLGDNCDSIEAGFNLNAAQFHAWNPSINAQCSNLWAGYYVCVHAPGAVANPPTSPSPTKPANGIETPKPTQPHMISYCNRFQWVHSGETCGDIAFRNGISLENFLKWNPSAGNECQGLWANAYACVDALPAFTLATYYHVDCTGEIHNDKSIQMQTDGDCINTDCQVGSVKAVPHGACPDGELQISYWEQPGCTGKWFGYGYTSRDRCHKMWTEGWKFKSLHLRCAARKDDCVSKGTCTFEPEPANNIC
ncbi:Peptidoglycan-binding lysin domain protein [Metarhizium rileyi]|uniref:Peptidoglycan-binding lysin domain protein n=1 Tax=Metarhizium rileyi (strain RCEF 4871) TaxID=1649241 RepID=A0A166Y3M5_METRR|nr:Peptidoglycan-binding lysin domain protein [Metarhizium rileyi RCEF 4871]